MSRIKAHNPTKVVTGGDSSRFLPPSASPIIYLGSGAFTVANVTSKADNYGMPAGTQPDPQTWAPMPGDQFIDLATGNVTVFTGTTAAPAPPPRTDGSDVRPSIGAASPVDLVPNTIGALDDVTVTAPKDGQHLVYKTDHWENQDIQQLQYRAITEAEYNALATKDPNTLYLIRP